MSAPLSARRGAAEILAQKLGQRGAPVSVVFQVTDRCNYDCAHCYETHGREPELELAEIDRILGELADLGTLFLTLTGGEVFMRRDADDILRGARRRGFAVRLLTTGWFVDDARAELIAALGAIQVEMSFYAGDPSIHDHVTHIAGSWRRTVDAARRLRARRVPVILKSPVMAANLAALTSMAGLAGELDCEFAFDPKVTAREDGDRGPLALRASDEALRAFYQLEESGIFQAAQASCGRGRALDETPCRAGHEVAGITPQGLVSACHSLPLHGGDLRKASFGDIWRSSPMIQRIRDLTWRHIAECDTCDVRAYCSRCHAMAYLEDGRVDGPSREACRHAVILRDLLRDRGLIPATETALPPPLAADRRRQRPPALRVVP